MMGLRQIMSMNADQLKIWKAQEAARALRREESRKAEQAARRDRVNFWIAVATVVAVVVVAIKIV